MANEPGLLQQVRNMFDIGWWELMVIGVVAIIVVGPKELPALLRTFGRYVGMAKRQADEFRKQFDEALSESEFKEFRDEMHNLRHGITTDFDDVNSRIMEATSGKPGDASGSGTRGADTNGTDTHGTGESNTGATSHRADDDLDDDEPMRPAPEIAARPHSDSFTMADGEVISKRQPEPPTAPDDRSQTADPAADAPAGSGEPRGDAPDGTARPHSASDRHDAEQIR